MINILTISSLALVALHMTVAPVSAHGYVSQPPSRQARCRDDRVPSCGPVQWEPQSVEALQGSFLCNGDGARFPELNDENLWRGHFFQVPPGQGARPLTFTWTLTALHRTASWEYFLRGHNNHLLASFPGHNETPPANTVEHSVPIHGHHGRHTILARWNIGDTPNTFYSCIDLHINPTETETAEGAEGTQLPIGVAVPLGLGLAMAANGSGSASPAGPNVNMILQNAFAVQGASSS